MARTTLRRALTTFSFLAVIMGGAAAPAVAAVDDVKFSTTCWMNACERRL